MSGCACEEVDAGYGHRMPGPDGTTYVVLRLRGCGLCGPVRLRILRLDEQAAEEWNAEDAPALPFEPWCDDATLAELPLFDPAEFAAEVREWQGEDPTFTIEDLVDPASGVVDEVVREAAAASWLAGGDR